MPVACLVVVLAAPETSVAQRVSTTSIVIGDDLALDQITLVSMGIRRGVRRLGNVRYRHLSDLVETPAASSDLLDAQDSLDPIAEAVQTGDPTAENEAANAVRVFEEYLAQVKRTELVDAYMLLALAACRARRTQDCAQGFERVVTFRENAVYDAERYPAEFLGLFEETRDRLVADGLRGSIEIRTDPPGAEVFVDGTSLGPAPVVAEGILTGEHYVTVKAQGYEEAAQRVTVEETYQATIDIPLYEGARVQLVNEQIPQIRRELGQPRAGPGIEALDPLVGTARQVVFAVVEPLDAELSLTMYVYDLRTNFLMHQIQGNVAASEQGSRQIEQLAADLYENVDLTGQIDAPDDGGTGGGIVIWEQWWFYAGIAAVIGATIAAIVLVPEIGGDADCAEGFTCFDADVE
jgi:hypothetical protein